MATADRWCLCRGNRYEAQQTQDIDPMLAQCWSSVGDGGTTLGAKCKALVRQLTVGSYQMN